MKRPDYLDEDLPAKIKVRHLTIEQKRVLRLNTPRTSNKDGLRLRGW